MKMFQAVFEWRNTESSSFFSTVDAAKDSFEEPDPITGRKRFGGERFIYEWKLDGKQFFCIATHFFEGGRWSKPGEWVRPEGEEIAVWVKATEPQEN